MAITGLFGQVFLADALDGFTGAAAPINAMSFATQNGSLNVGDTVKVPFATSNSSSANFDYSAPYGSDSVNIGVKNVTLSNLLYQKYTITDADSAKLTTGQLSAFAKQAGEKLANDVVSASFASVISDVNYSVSASIVSTALTSSSAIADLVTQADTALWPSDNRNIILSPTAWNSLIKNTGLNQAFSYGGSQVIQNGLPANVMGFNVYKTNVTMPNNCKALVLNPNALLFATGEHKPSVASTGLVDYQSATRNGITITMKAWYDAANASTHYVYECLFGVLAGNTLGLYQMK
jgi:hypothetical protein